LTLPENPAGVSTTVTDNLGTEYTIGGSSSNNSAATTFAYQNGTITVSVSSDGSNFYVTFSSTFGSGTCTFTVPGGTVYRHTHSRFSTGEILAYDPERLQDGTVIAFTTCCKCLQGAFWLSLAAAVALGCGAAALGAPAVVTALALGEITGNLGAICTAGGVIMAAISGGIGGVYGFQHC